MIEIYCWEDDDEAQRLVEELTKRELPHEVSLLDPEMGGGESCVISEGKTYWKFREFLESLEA